MAGLALDLPQLEEIRDTLSERIRQGLAREGQEIRALPAWLPRPRPGLEGTALVMDTGGTNMRAALVEVEPSGRCSVVAGPLEQPVPTGRDGSPVTAAAFFEAQAALVEGLAAPAGLPLGYCFSYPAEITPEADARLIRWTKGVEVAGVEGNLVGAPLARALGAAGRAPRCVRVLNDTVAALLAGAGQRAGDFDAFVGLIAGTGTNMAGFWAPAEIPKLPAGWPHEAMAVNLESGNYDPPHLTGWDEALDRERDHPGRQRFEKALSGYYLPYLYQQVARREGFDPSQGAGQLVALRDVGKDEIAAAVLARSADLVAAGLAAVIAANRRPERVGIVAEGSLFWGDPQFRPRVERTLARLVGSPFEILRIPDANLVGSAYAALP